MNDLKIFAEKYGKNNAHNEVIGCFESSESEQCLTICKKTKATNRFIISGSLSSNQNCITIKNFFKKYYLLLPSQSTITIAGKHPSEGIKNLCRLYPNVELVPNPVDMKKIISQADIYICPIEIGGGLKLRIMDGLRNGLPVLAHKNAARGYDMFFDKEWFQIYDDENSFLQALDRITCYIQTNDYLIQSIMKEYFKYFSYESGKGKIYSCLLNRN
jgi:glycosyltransferase involved in cell wall biosynthesis